MSPFYTYKRIIDRNDEEDQLQEHLDNRFQLSFPGRVNQHSNEPSPIWFRRVPGRDRYTFRGHLGTRETIQF